MSSRNDKAPSQQQRDTRNTNALIPSITKLTETSTDSLYRQGKRKSLLKNENNPMQIMNQTVRISDM